MQIYKFRNQSKAVSSVLDRPVTVDECWHKRMEALWLSDCMRAASSFAFPV